MNDLVQAAKLLEEKYGTKQRDALRAKSPAIAAEVEKLEETFGPVKVDIVTKEDQQRTVLQNKALHKYFELLAEAMNDAGWEMKRFFSIKPEIEIPWNKDRVKANLWKIVQEMMIGKKSTSKLNTKEVNDVYVVLDRHISSVTGVHVEFPKDEEKP